MKIIDNITDIRNAIVSIAKSQERISQMITRLVLHLEKKIK